MKATHIGLAAQWHLPEEDYILRIEFAGFDVSAGECRSLE
jgi:hypothetical protein